MKKLRPPLLFITYVIIKTTCSAQDSIPTDSVQRSRFSAGIIPILAYDSDLGLKYGAVVNVFDHGKAQLANKYKQYWFFRLWNSTKSSSQAQLLFESDVLIPNSKLIAEISFMADKALDFYGFNGRQSVFNNGFVTPGHKDFLNKFYYAYDRKLSRYRVDVQRNLGNEKIRFLSGLSYFNYRVSDVDYEALGVGEMQTSLFTNYKEHGLIKAEEYNGGKAGLLAVGLILDTRNDKCYCTNGIWTESIIYWSPKGVSDAAFSKLVLTYRQHKGFINDKLVLSLRLSSQTKLSGQIPFYILPSYFDSRLNQDGVGGAFTLRGAKRNRIISDGFLLANTEVKGRLFNMNLLGVQFEFSSSAFVDMAYITQDYQINLSDVPTDYRSQHFSGSDSGPYLTTGLGLYIVFNDNNVLTVNYGIPLNSIDGTGGLYVGSSLLF